MYMYKKKLSYMYQTKIKYIIFFSSFKYIPSRHITKTAPDAYVNYTFYHVLYTCTCEGEATRLADLTLISITYFANIFKTSSLFFSIPFSGGFYISTQ